MAASIRPWAAFERFSAECSISERESDMRRMRTYLEEPARLVVSHITPTPAEYQPDTGAKKRSLLTVAEWIAPAAVSVTFSVQLSRRQAPDASEPATSWAVPGDIVARAPCRLAAPAAGVFHSVS